MENILKFIGSIQASPEAALEFLFGSFLFMGTNAMGGLGALRAWAGFVLGLLLKIQTHLSKICSVGFPAAFPAQGSLWCPRGGGTSCWSWMWDFSSKKDLSESQPVLKCTLKRETQSHECLLGLLITDLSCSVFAVCLNTPPRAVFRGHRGDLHVFSLP